MSTQNEEEPLFVTDDDTNQTAVFEFNDLDVEAWCASQNTSGNDFSHPFIPPTVLLTSPVIDLSSYFINDVPNEVRQDVSPETPHDLTHDFTLFDDSMDFVDTNLNIPQSSISSSDSLNYNELIPSANSKSQALEAKVRNVSDLTPSQSLDASTTPTRPILSRQQQDEEAKYHAKLARLPRPSLRHIITPPAHMMANEEGTSTTPHQARCSPVSSSSQPDRSPVTEHSSTENPSVPGSTASSPQRPCTPPSMSRIAKPLTTTRSRFRVPRGLTTSPSPEPRRSVRIAQSHSSDSVSIDYAADPDLYSHDRILPVNDVNHPAFVSQKDRGSYKQDLVGDAVHPRPRGPPAEKMEWGRGLAGGIPHGYAHNEMYLRPEETTAALVGEWAPPGKRRRINGDGNSKVTYATSPHGHGAVDASEGDDFEGSQSPQIHSANANKSPHGRRRHNPHESAKLGGYTPTYANYPQQRVSNNAADETASEFSTNTTFEAYDSDPFSQSNTARHGGLLGISRPNPNLLPSRDSGYVMHHDGTNLAPKLYPTEQVSDAYLAKRGITRTAGPLIPRRAHGANDPDNIFIVNKYENEAWTWGRIADGLNQKCIREGKPPKFTSNAVQNRYNRNAPLMHAAEGKEFIPLSQRKLGERKTVYTPQWNEDLDNALVRAVKQVDGSRWKAVASIFNAETGEHINEKAAAMRHHHI